MKGKRIEINSSKSGGIYPIIVAPNQKVIQIHRIRKAINFEANKAALATLSANGYVLYMYLLMHPEGRIWALSSKDVYNRTPLTEKTYTVAMKELIAKGYLTEGEIFINTYSATTFKENAWHFWERPELRFAEIIPENNVGSS